MLTAHRQPPSATEPLDKALTDVESGGERQLLFGDRDDQHFEQRGRP
jgi:hypothetical protein